ncbi:MAG: hypothetical protein JWQ32_335 [Marmoricola sp.]|nr:hypothetical protein [Marmoricola sp.]
MLRGAAGSVLLTIGGFCYVHLAHPSWIDGTPLSALRKAPHHLDLGLLLSGIGLLLLTWAWWRLRPFALDDETGVRSVRIAVGLWSIPLLIAPPLFSGDGWSYVATGYLTGHGLSPYVWTPSILPAPLQSGVNERWLHTLSPYGPLAQGWGGLAAQFTSNPWALLVAYRVFALVGVALIAWATPRLARRAGIHPGRASWLVLASPFMIAHGIGGLHNDVVVAGLGVAALALTTRDRWVAGAVLAGAAAAVKVPGGLIAVGVVLLSLQIGATTVQRVRRAAGVLGVGAATVLGLGIVTGVGNGWVRTLSVATSVPTRLSLTTSLGESLRHVLRKVGAPVTGPGGITMVSLVDAIGVLVLVCGAIALVIRSRLDDEGSSLTSAAILMFAVTMLSPAMHYWYFLWCLPLLACVRLPRPARDTLHVGVVVMGLIALADSSLNIGWLTTSAAIAMTCVPPLVFLVSSGHQPRTVGTADVAAAKPA